VVEGIECPKGSDSLYSKSLSYEGSPTFDKKGKPIKGKDLYSIIKNENDEYCSITNFSNNGNVYKVKIECMSGVGAIPLEKGQWTITVLSETSFSKKNDTEQQKSTGKKETVYHYCVNSK